MKNPIPKIHSLFLISSIVFAFLCNSVQAQVCTITGPTSVPPGVDITYITNILNQNWEVYSYNGASAQIVYTNSDTLVLNTGPNAGNYTVYVLSNPNYTLLCSLNVVVDPTLPVELSSFVSSIDKNNVLLYWTTLFEENNSGFQIERLKANEDWLPVAFINGNGTINTPVDYTYSDKNLQSGIYKYRLKQIDYNGDYQYYFLPNEVVIGSPERFALYQNYPNPFNPETRINFDLAFDALVKLSVFDVTGKVVKVLLDETISAGFHSTSFNAKDLPAGIYFYRITISANSPLDRSARVETVNITAVKRMMLIK